MSRSTNRRGTVVAALTGMLLLVAVVPAGAHPFVTGGELPARSLVDVTLAMAHGCGTEQAGGGDPTLEVAMEVPEQVRIVDVAEQEGWQIDVARDDGGRAQVVTWRAISALEPAPDLEFAAVFEGDPGDEVHLKVFQGCEDFAYRWIGTPDEPASQPAVRVVLTEPDPGSPPPPELEDEPVADESTEQGPAVDEQPAERAPTDDDRTDTREQDSPSEEDAEVDAGVGPRVLVAGALAVTAMALVAWWRRRG